MEGDCNVYAHSSLWMRPTWPDRYNMRMVYLSVWGSFITSFIIQQPVAWQIEGKKTEEIKENEKKLSKSLATPLPVDWFINMAVVLGTIQIYNISPLDCVCKTEKYKRTLLKLIEGQSYIQIVNPNVSAVITGYYDHNDDNKSACKWQVW